MLSALSELEELPQQAKWRLQNLGYSLACIPRLSSSQEGEAGLLLTKTRCKEWALQHWPVVIFQDISVRFVLTEHKVPLAASLH